MKFPVILKGMTAVKMFQVIYDDHLKEFLVQWLSHFLGNFEFVIKLDGKLKVLFA